MAPKLYLYQRHIEEVQKFSQKMTLQMSEKYLAQFETSCIQRHFCLIGAVRDTIDSENKENVEGSNDDTQEVTEYSVM